ncbi:hypothetical protein J6590_103260 [Homalodisca vitripennis]|nr:hypothetical protein J6590_103260 [Homalodisca vitripennis]
MSYPSSLRLGLHFLIPEYTGGQGLIRGNEGSDLCINGLPDEGPMAQQRHSSHHQERSDHAL